MHRMRTRLTLTVVACAVVLLSGSAAAAPDAAAPRGWYAGTIVVQAQWDRLASDLRFRGSATLRVERTGPETASYELEYAEEWHYRENTFEPECRGKLRQRMTSSWKTTAQIHVLAREQSPGVSLFLRPRSGDDFLNAPLTGREFRDCTTGEGGETYNAGTLGLQFGFATPQPASAETRQGTAQLGTNPFGNVGEPTPGGVNRASATYDLRLVRVILPPGRPTRLAIDRERLSVRPFEVRRGSKLQVSIGEPQLLDANGTTVATSGTGGCEVTYYKGNNVRLVSRSIRGSWTPAKLTCAWQVPRTGRLAREIATQNVQIRVAPWVSRGGARYWARPQGDHALFIISVERSR